MSIFQKSVIPGDHEHPATVAELFQTRDKFAN